MCRTAPRVSAGAIRCAVMSERIPRINEAMREILSEAIADLSDPRIGFVTVTGVRAARDLRSARVFVSVLGSADAREDSLSALRSAHGLLQREVARQIRLHHTPQLQFEHDDTADTAQRIDELLKRGEEH